MTELLSASPNSTYPNVIIQLTVQQLTKLGVNRKLANAINTLPEKPYSSYLKIINDEGLLVMINDVLNNGSRDIATELFRLNQTIVTTTFNRLIENMLSNVDHFGKAIHDKICWRLSNIREPIPFSILRSIYDTAIYGLDRAEQNSNVVVESSKNVQIARDIEALNLTSYPLLLQYFTKFSHFRKTSASESIIFNAMFTPQAGLNYLKMRNTLSQRQVFFKIFPIGSFINEEGLKGVYNTTGLEIESAIYERLGKLVEFGVTPNILCSVWSGKIGQFDTEFINNPKLPKEFKDACFDDVVIINENNRARNTVEVWKETGVVITLPGDSLLQSVVAKLTPAERKQVFFQIIYTLYVFDHIEMSHGDLHSNNIFIQNVPPTTLNFQIQGRHYRMTTTKLVKIYDFDRGTICKNTDIKLNIRDSFTVNALLNINRAEGKFFNRVYAETNIYNKHLDFLILFAFGLMAGSDPDDLKNLNYFEGVDPVFNDFMRFCIPGFDVNNPISDETIRDTYIRIFESDKKSRDEASVLFNIDKFTEDFVFSQFGVDNEVLNMRWIDYYLRIHVHFGRPVKILHGMDNNQLWIPDEIIIPKEDMLMSPYFEEYYTRDPINTKKGVVYSIDNRVL
jgi:hypothetical protein